MPACETARWCFVPPSLANSCFLWAGTSVSKTILGPVHYLTSVLKAVHSPENRGVSFSYFFFFFSFFLTLPSFNLSGSFFLLHTGMLFCTFISTTFRENIWLAQLPELIRHFVPRPDSSGQADFEQILHGKQSTRSVRRNAHLGLTWVCVQGRGQSLVCKHGTIFSTSVSN